MKGQSSNLPSSVSVRFQSRRCNGLPTSTIPLFYEKVIDIEDGASIGGLEGHPGTKIFLDRALALYDGGGTEPTNKTALDTLASQIALDFYDWNKDSFDESYPGIISPVLDGLTDTIEWEYRRDRCITRRYSSIASGYPEDLMHHDPANTSCNGNDSLKTPCFESYGPVAGGASNLTVQVFKNCLHEGTLTQEYVRTESIGCGCAPGNCANLTAKIKGYCPWDSSDVSTSGLTVKLYKDGVFVANGAYDNTNPLNIVYKWTGITKGTGYSIEIADGYPSKFHAYSSGEFTIGDDCKAPDINLYKWLGWQDAIVHVNYCSSGNYVGVTVKIEQNGTTYTQVTGADGVAHFGPILGFDPATRIPYPLSVTVTPLTSRMNPRSFTYSWGDVPPANRCGVIPTSPNVFVSDPSGDNLFKTSTCTDEGDVVGGYQCQGTFNDGGVPCRTPFKKSLSLEDSKYGGTVLTYMGCDGSGRPYYQGSTSASVPECKVKKNCPLPTPPFGRTEDVTCPATSVTITYILYILGDLTVTYKTGSKGCEFGGGEILCPDNAGATEINANFVDANVPGESNCGGTYFRVWQKSPGVGTKCPTDPLDTNHSSDIYFEGATITVTES